MCIKAVKNVDGEPLLPPTRPIKVVNIVDDGEKLQYREDVLAKTTQYTRVVFDGFAALHQWFQSSHYYKILFGTTQPAHLIMALAVIAVSLLIHPRGINTGAATYSPLLMVTYMASFSSHFGSQVWMTFVSGLALYFNIPRHTFGNIQKVLFPKYFLINACLSFMNLTIFMVMKKSDMHQLEVAAQAIALTTSFLIELVIRLYLTNPLLHLICVKTQIEEAAGVGMEIGRLNPGTLMDCPYYLKIHRTFRKTHMMIAMGNMVSLGCSVLHLVYLSYKICSL